MSRLARRVILTFLIWFVILGCAAFAVVGYLLPYLRAENTMPASGRMVLTRLEDGSTEISWPRGIYAQQHVLEVLRPLEGAEDGEAQAEILYRADIYDQTSHILPELPAEELTIRVRSVHSYFFPFEEAPRQRFGELDMQITGTFAPPQIGNLTWAADAEDKTVTVRFDLPQDCTAQLQYVQADGTKQLYKTLTDGKITLNFGEGADFPVPGLGERHSFEIAVAREQEAYSYLGGVSGSFSVEREDLLGTKLDLQCTNLGNNVFSFTWNETKGSGYVLQQYNDNTQQWETLRHFALDEPRTYTTGHLPRYSDIRFRVAALRGQAVTDGEFVAAPDTVVVTTGVTPVFSTVWPVQDLDIYSDTAGTEVIGRAPGAQAYCVLDEVDGKFRIRQGDLEGYIDSSYCMINLPEYLGDLCLYDMVNSYDSLYMAHEYEIPTVTGEVITGYENVRMESGEYLVPLLYPAAKKLEKAAFAARNEGYQLRIYDSFRPRKATRALYDQAVDLGKEPIPEDTYTGIVPDDLPELPEGTILTYEMLMTDQGRYTMSYFLASSGSRHNQGIAMDLTLAGLWDEEDLPMQTSIHDLSWYSEQTRNNDNARLLSKIMTEAGFTGLVSEWWHFQDNDALNDYAPEYLWSGVSPQCWMADDRGWRYRMEDGSYCTDCQTEIDGVRYCFDAQGYVMPEEEGGKPQ